jgi:hypothetical protein
MKGGLFLGLGILSAAMLLWHARSPTVAILLAITVWAFFRAYYFAFYVIQHYVDPKFRFAGLTDFVRYAVFGTQPDQSDGRGA